MLDDTEFQAHAAATGKARSPIMDRRVDGTVSVDVLADRISISISHKFI